MAPQSADHYGLGDPLMLDRIDKLFACGVGEHVNLPQIVVVGDQSSGKSSVLEGLIRKPLPRDSGLCTRFATHIVFRRAAEESISVSILADRDASPEHRAEVEAWKKDNLVSLDGEEFSQIMAEVHDVMGLGRKSDDIGRKPTFSNDVLLLEIAGPKQEHLSVIDVPGIFKNTEPGKTTRADIKLVRSMVTGYMENPRSVMLTVVAANVDVATQEILELAKEVDPEGDRTLGVLTKPDLVDKGAESGVIDLVEGRTRKTKLGWHVVRNPGQQELQQAVDRSSLESDFFRSTAHWSIIGKDKIGVEALRDRLKEVLSGLVGKEFPKVQQEINKKLSKSQKQLKDLGPARDSREAQTSFLTTMATEFQRLVTLALGAKYGSDETFDSYPALRIAPAVVSRMNEFSDDIARNGHQYSFLAQDAAPESSEKSQSSENAEIQQEASADSTDAEDENDLTNMAAHANGLEIRKEEDLDELADILHPQERIAASKQLGIEGWLQSVYTSGRGFELGTFDASILATTMKKQSTKWNSISLGYVSDIIVITHKFINTALQSVCTDRRVREALSGVISDGLAARYHTSIKHAKFLLEVEKEGIPMTTNHYFNENLQKSRQNRVMSEMAKAAFDDCSHGQVVRLQDAISTHPMSNADHTINDIHDILESYYKVARKRFTDNVSKQAVDHFLLNGPDTPLRYFTPVLVSQMSAEDVEHIAGEDPRAKRLRAQLNKQIASLTEAHRILKRG